MLHYREKNNLTLQITLILSFSLMTRSSFLDSSASFKPVIKGKLIVNMKTHIELNQFVMFLKTSPALNIKKFIH